MNSFHFDWGGVLTGSPAAWLVAGLVNTILITITGTFVASLLAIVVLLGRTSSAH